MSVEHLTSNGERRARSDAPYLGDRLPPHSIEAEQAVLGCCLLDPKEALGLAMERIGGRTEVFFDGIHGLVFGVMAGMVNAGMPVDPITLQTRLRDGKTGDGGSLLDQVERYGGMGWLAGLMNCTPSAANLEYYLETVLGKWRLRRVLAVCTRSMLRVYEEQEGDVGVLVNSIETEVLEAGEDSGEAKGIKSMVDVVRRTADKVEGCFRRGKGIIDGVPTGFSYLDKMLGGLHNGEYVVLGARPSCGKTAMMMGIAKHVARVQKKKVGIFSVEMQDTALVLRLWCDMAGVNMQQVRTGFATTRDMDRLGAYMPELAKLGMCFDDTANLDVQTFRARARRMKREGVALILVDYVQLMSNPDLEGRERHLEVASVSKGIKAACKELNLPIVVLAQLNRETAKDSNRRPRMDDLGESGQLEKDGDVIGLLYKPKTHRSKEEKVEGDFDEDGNEEGAKVIPVNLLIAKQRNGPTGDCEFLFHKEFMRFEDRYGGKGAQSGEAGVREQMTNDEMTDDKGSPKTKGGGKVEMPTDEELGISR